MEPKYKIGDIIRWEYPNKDWGYQLIYNIDIDRKKYNYFVVWPQHNRYKYDFPIEIFDKETCYTREVIKNTKILNILYGS